MGFGKTHFQHVWRSADGLLHGSDGFDSVGWNVLYPSGRRLAGCQIPGYLRTRIHSARLSRRIKRRRQARIRGSRTPFRAASEGGAGSAPAPTRRARSVLPTDGSRDDGGSWFAAVRSTRVVVATRIMPLR